MKTLLITGAAGFIGRRMTAAAQDAGWRVIGLDRTAEPCAGGGRKTACWEFSKLIGPEAVLR